MKKGIYLGTVAAAIAATTLGIGFDNRTEKVSFINPIQLIQSICGDNKNKINSRRAYFMSIGAAHAQSIALKSNDNYSAQFNPDIHYEISTRNPEVQKLFDTGLAHMWNFNHAEAIKAFQKAQEVDPDCAMCFWAEGFAYGPNINSPMMEEANMLAFEASRKAVLRRELATEKERLLIDALARRYSSKWSLERTALDTDFAEDMDNAARAYPEDNFILSLAAEANMDSQVWDYWELNGRTPKGRSARTVELLETVLNRDPSYIPAIHLYIHITEATDNPFRALSFADRLGGLSQGLGHLIHMPSHSYFRVGQFEKSLEANIAAVSTDEAYLESFDSSPLYEFGYYVHNVHFVMVSAAMAGAGDIAQEMALKLDNKLPREMAAAVPLAQPIKVAPYFVMAQFGDPADVLTMEDPGDALPYLKAIWHYARGEAYVKLGNYNLAKDEALSINKIAQSTDFSELEDIHGIPVSSILDIAKLTVSARITAGQNDLPTAIKQMEEVVALQDVIAYTEPPYWYYPSRQTLASMVLQNGEVERAEQLFLGALAKSPNNGWVLYGLSETYKNLGDKKAAKYARNLMKKVWLGDRKDLNLERL